MASRMILYLCGLVDEGQMVGEKMRGASAESLSCYIAQPRNLDCLIGGLTASSYITFG